MTVADPLSLPRMSILINLDSGKQVSFSEGGDRAGIPVIFIPGVSGNRFWTAVYDELAREHGIRFITFDRPGRGGSEAQRKGWGFHSWAGHLDELTDILKIPRFFLLTHSCGSSYALAAYPQLKDKIIGSIRMLAMWTPTNLPCMPTSYAVTRSLPTSMVRAWFSISLASQSTSWQIGPKSLREAECALAFSPILDRIGIENSSSDYKACEADWLLSLEMTNKMNIPFESLDVSVRCWHGMDDTIVPLGSVMWMQKQMKNFLLFAVEGASHNIQLDMSIVRAVFADIVKEATDIRLSTFVQNSLQSLP